MKLPTERSRSRWTFNFYFLLAVTVFAPLLAGFRPISVSPENIALSGYDTVAYFLQDKAVKGSPANSIEWHGAVWRFHSKSNLRLFKKSPEKFAPTFGGYCALAVAEGEVVTCNPEAFHIEDGKLYVMKNHEILEIWKNNPKSYMIKARLEWARMMQEVEGNVQE